jgi:hypothetical protein
MPPDDALQSEQSLIGTLFLKLLERSGIGAGTAGARVHGPAHEVFAGPIVEKKRPHRVMVRLHQTRVADEPMLSVDSLEMAQNTHEKRSPDLFLIIVEPKYFSRRLARW